MNFRVGFADLLLAALVSTAVSCSGGGEEYDWYDQSKEISGRNDERQKQYMEAGLDEVEAHKAASLDYFVERSRGYEPTTIEGEEMQEYLKE